jgi:hypothetical protein
MSEINHFNFFFTMEDYVADVVMICQLEDEVDTLHAKRMNCSRSHKYRYRETYASEM